MSKKQWSGCLFFIFYFFVTSSCTKNILGDFVRSDTDKAKLYAARILMNNKQYSQAILKFSDMSEKFLAQRETKLYYASAHTGFCGMAFLELVHSLSHLGTTKLLRALMGSFPGATVLNSESCIFAENIMKSIGDHTERTIDENILMAYISFTKVGTILSRVADTDDNGIPDAIYNDGCGSSISSTDAKQVATGLSVAVNSIAAAAAKGTDVGSEPFKELTKACNQLPAIFNFCAATDVSEITSDMEKGVRTLIREPEHLGIGSCRPDFVTCTCP